MTENKTSWIVAVLLSVGATLAALLLGGRLLFTDVTTLPGTTEPASALEAGNVVLITMAVVPVALAGAGLFGVYRRRRNVTLYSGVALLILGVVGLQYGFFYIAMGLGLIVSYFLAR